MEADAIDRLERLLDAATGSDTTIDGEVASLFETAQADFTASVDRATGLVKASLPGWSWHVGWDANGILPYARLDKDHREVHARAPTVPIALLKVALAALRLERR